LAKAVILATFFDVRAPLSGINIRFEDIDAQIIFGKGVLLEHLNDDAIGRALDRISEKNLETMFSTLCLTAYVIYRIAFKRLHSDTTTISFYDEYEPGEIDKSEEEILSIGRGYNKDHRPEYKQIVVGKIVSEHGVPMVSLPMDGNTADVDWNKKAMELAANIFEKELEQGIYIANSKLINMEMFKTLKNPKKKIKFISRCPANFYNKPEDKTIEKAYQDGK
jgi:transposase